MPLDYNKRRGRTCHRSLGVGLVVVATNAEKPAHQDQILKMVRVRGAKTIVAAYPVVLHSNVTSWIWRQGP